MDAASKINSKAEDCAERLVEALDEPDLRKRRAAFYFELYVKLHEWDKAYGEEKEIKRIRVDAMLAALKVDQCAYVADTWAKLLRDKE